MEVDLDGGDWSTDARSTVTNLTATASLANFWAQVRELERI
jgi:hypothetical protein